MRACQQHNAELSQMSPPSLYISPELNKLFDIYTHDRNDIQLDKTVYLYGICVNNSFIIMNVAFLIYHFIIY